MLLKSSAPLAHLKAAMQQMGYDMANTWMCRLGGAPLPHDDSLTIAECGLGANSCVHVMGRLPGGGEATIREQKYLFDDSVGHLDLGGNGLGSVEVKEVATFLVSHEGATVRRLTLSGNEITDGGKDMSGLTALCEILPTLKHPISLDLANCGLGVAEVNELASAIQAGAAVDAVAIGGNPIGSAGGATLLETIKTSKLKTIDIGKPLPLQEPYESDTLDLSNTQMDPGHVLLLSWWLATDAGAAVARLILNENPLTGGRRNSDFDTDITGITALCDTLKTSSVTELGLAKCRLGPGSLGKLAEYVRDADAAVARLSLSGNRLTNNDKDLTGLKALCEALLGLKNPISLDLSNC
ncbi:MAG: hypothetical protein VX386_07465, partial [Pseudomonadota bacterium]|nr:hypothetical protein [Pseudomonadota bacterium]